MSILDDAIREHLELKRAHGADEAEVKKLEDEAFGPPQRPGEADAFAEAPTEFLTAPGAEEQAGEGAEAEGRRIPNIADLQEAPPAPRPPEPSEGPATEEPRAPEPSIEEQPAAEHKVVPAPESEPSPEPEQAAPAPEAQDQLDKPDGVHTTEEREAIADQPTQMFDVEAEMQSGAEAESPSDEQLLDAEMGEPRLAPVDPIAGIEATTGAPADEPPPEHDDDDDFFSEQRLSEELDNALEAPVTDEQSLPPLPPEPAARTEEGTAIFDIEEHADDNDRADDEDYEDADSGEYEAIEPEPPSPAPAAPAPEASEPPATAEPTEANPYDPDTESHEDVLEDTPEFLEDAPEDENAWFEQRPPKDFDFDD